VIKNYWITLLAIVSISPSLLGQEGLRSEQKKAYYYQIPDAPDSYDAYTVAARVVDGLGFRYYWATEGLRDEDLDYKASETTRTSRQTLEHIHGLCKMVHNAVLTKPNTRGDKVDELSFESLRNETLSLLQSTSKILKAEDPKDMTEYAIIFQRGESTSELPFWNILNGPLSDAMWHVGQVVAMRRLSGNPFDSRVSVLSGRRRGE